MTKTPSITGFAWTHQLLLVDGLRLSYALTGCKDNPAVESFHGRFKTENESLFLEATCLPELRAIVTTQMDYYNKDRRHSSLGYLPPLRYMKQMQSKASYRMWARAIEMWKTLQADRSGFPTF